MLEQILVPIGAAHLEVIRARPLGQALDLVPAIKNLRHFGPLPVQQKASWSLVRFLPRVTLHLERNELPRVQAGILP